MKKPPDADCHKADEAGRLLFIDSIEAGVAQVMDRDGNTGRLPGALLPPGAKEGTWIELRVVPAPPGDDPAALRQRLSRGDDGGDVKL